MKQNDAQMWLRFFYSRGYLPTKTLRARRGYLGQIDFEAGINLIHENEDTCPVRIVFPFFKNPDKSIAVFPQITTLENGQFYEIKESILYAGKFYNLDSFIQAANEPREVGRLSEYVLPLHFFMLDTDGFNVFKKSHLTPVRKRITATGVYEGGLCGGGRQHLLKDRNKLIIQFAKTNQKKYRTLKELCEGIGYFLKDEADRRNLDPKSDEYRRFTPRELALYLVLKKAGFKLKK